MFNVFALPTSPLSWYQNCVRFCFIRQFNFPPLTPSLPLQLPLCLFASSPSSSPPALPLFFQLLSFPPMSARLPSHSPPIPFSYLHLAFTNAALTVTVAGKTIGLTLSPNWVAATFKLSCTIMQMFRFKEKEMFHLLLVIGRFFCRRIVFDSNYFFPYPVCLTARKKKISILQLSWIVLLENF